MRVAALVAAGRNRVERHTAGGQAGGFDGKLEVLRGQPVAPVVEPASLDPRAAQQRLGGGDAEGGATVAGAERGRLGRILDFPLGENHAIGRVELQAVPEELEGHARGKIVGHRERRDLVMLCPQQDDLGGPDAPVGPALARLQVPGFQRQDHVEARGALDPPELQGADHAHLAAPGAEGDEWVGHLDAAEIALVRIRV